MKSIKTEGTDEELPDYLPLGSDAVKIVSDAFQARLVSVEKWKNISVQTDSDEKMR